MGWIQNEGPESPLLISFTANSFGSSAGPFLWRRPVPALFPLTKNLCSTEGKRISVSFLDNYNPCKQFLSSRGPSALVGIDTSYLWTETYIRIRSNYPLNRQTSVPMPRCPGALINQGCTASPNSLAPLDLGSRRPRIFNRNVSCLLSCGDVVGIYSSGVSVTSSNHVLYSITASPHTARNQVQLTTFSLSPWDLLQHYSATLFACTVQYIN